MAGFLTSSSVSLNNGSNVVNVTGSVDCSFVVSGTAVYINDILMEGVSGTASDLSGNSTITLRNVYTGSSIVGGTLVAFNTIEGLRDAIQRARDLSAVQESNNLQLESFLTSTLASVDLELPSGTITVEPYKYLLSRVSSVEADQSSLLRKDDNLLGLTNKPASRGNLGLGTSAVLDAGVANGVASLDGNGKVPLTQINDSILGQVEYKGLWDPSNNTPALPTTPTEKGHYYICSSIGTQFGTVFAIGDWIISSGTSWDKVDNTDAVSSVQGRTGNVVITASDVNAYTKQESDTRYLGADEGVVADIEQWKKHLYPLWISDAGLGVPFAYPQGMIINHSGQNWVSNEAENKEEPDTGSKWSLYSALEKSRIPTTVAEIAAGTFKVGDRLEITDRSNAPSVVEIGTANGANLLAAGVGNVARLEIENNKTYSAHWGITISPSTTSNTQAFFKYVMENKIRGVISAGDYEINAEIAAITSSNTAIFSCINGQAVFKYVGVTEIPKLLSATNCEAVQMKNISFDGNELVASPLDLRAPVSGARSVILMETHVSNAKQTTGASSSSGIFISGTYVNTDLLNCNVKNVTYTTAGLACVGIAVVAATGKIRLQGCNVDTVTSPHDIDADGISVFGAEFAAGSLPTTAKAEIVGCSLTNCKGRAVKLQIADVQAYANTIKLRDGFTTITEWRGFDAQDGGADIHNNRYDIGSGVTLGSASSLCQLTSIRNTGVANVARFEDNSCSTKSTGLMRLASTLAGLGSSAFYVNRNKIIGQPISRGVQFRANGGLVGLGRAILECKGNEFEDLTNQDLFDPFDGVDFGDKLRLNFADNKVLNNTSVARFYSSIAGFSVGANFQLGQNTNIQNAVDWSFNMNDLRGDNYFRVGSQAISNQAPTVGDFFSVVTEGGIQRNISFDASIEARRASYNGLNISPWVVV